MPRFHGLSKGSPVGGGCMLLASQKPMITPKKLLTGEIFRRGVAEGEGVKVEKSINVQKSVEELYAYWSRLENLPAIMRHLKSVTVSPDGKSHWVAQTIGGLNVEWDAEVINLHENEMIAWQSLPNSEVENAGSVRFRVLEGGKGTEVRVNLKYNPPLGKAGVALAKLFRLDAAAEIENDLAHFKQIMETGEIATTEGQPSARKDKKLH